MGTLYDHAVGDSTAQTLLGIPPDGAPVIDPALFMDEFSGDLMQCASWMQGAGIRSYSGRSVFYQGRPTHFESMTKSQLLALTGTLYQEFGVVMREFGMRLGKAVLLPDSRIGFLGTKMTEEAYLDEVKRVAELANAVATSDLTRDTSDGRKLRARIFNFYPEDPKTMASCNVPSFDSTFDRACDLAGKQQEILTDADLDAVNEVETKLQGWNVERLKKMAAVVDNFQTLFDVGNLTSAGYDAQAVKQQFLDQVGSTGTGMHIKAFLKKPGIQPGDPLNEETLDGFGPVHLCEAHDLVLKELASQIVAIEKRLGLKTGQFLLILEPHFLKGGQFGGFSGAPGMGIAWRSLQLALHKAGIFYRLPQFEDADIRGDMADVVQSC